MFHMTNDSNLFRARQELDEQEGAYPIGGNRFRSAAGDWLPLYEGKMIQIFILSLIPESHSRYAIHDI
jgi:hypothetical protein